MIILNSVAQWVRAFTTCLQVSCWDFSYFYHKFPKMLKTYSIWPNIVNLYLNGKSVLIITQFYAHQYQQVSHTTSNNIFCPGSPAVKSIAQCVIYFALFTILIFFVATTYTSFRFLSKYSDLFISWAVVALAWIKNVLVFPQEVVGGVWVFRVLLCLQGWVGVRCWCPRLNLGNFTYVLREGVGLDPPSHLFPKSGTR